jgi:hypothetical protein
MCHNIVDTQLVETILLRIGRPSTTSSKGHTLHEDRGPDERPRSTSLMIDISWNDAHGVRPVHHLFTHSLSQSKTEL